jgi:hypothetical protein
MKGGIQKLTPEQENVIWVIENNILNHQQLVLSGEEFNCQQNTL